MPKVTTIFPHTYDGVAREIGASYEVNDPQMLETLQGLGWVRATDDPPATPSTPEHSHPPPLEHENHDRGAHHRGRRSHGE